MAPFSFKPKLPLVLLLSLVFFCVHTTTVHALPSRSMAYAYYLQALLEMSSGRLADASQSLKRVLDLDPESVAIMEELARVNTGMDNLQDAAKWAEQAIDLESDNPEMKMVLARFYAGENRIAEALAFLEDMLNSEPDDQEALFLTGTIYAQAKDFSKAIEFLRKATEQGGRRSFMARYYLGRIYRDAGDLLKAQECLNEAVNLNPHFIAVHLDLADVYRRLGETDRAIESYKALLAQQPYNLKVRELLVMLLFEIKREDEALSELCHLKQLAVKDPENGFRVAVLCLRLGKYDDALYILQQIGKAYPDQGRILLYTAVVYEEKGDDYAALRTLKSIDVDDEFAVEAGIRQAYLLKKKGQIDKAIKLIEHGLKHRPNTAQWILCLATLYEDEDRLLDAEEILSNALDVIHNDKELLFHYAMILDKLGKRRKAIESAQRAIEIDTKYIHALNYLGYTYAEEGINLDEAESLIKRALSLQPDDGYITDSLGWVYFKRGEIDKAISYLSKAHKLACEDPVITEHLGDAYRAKGMYEKALQLYQDALKLLKKPKGKPRLKKKIRKTKQKLECS